jgi:prepilin-type N-terminal cleavage/methylation domain-containing protein
MKKSFTLIELIFTILIISIISAIAVPKLNDYLSKSTSTTITQDIRTITNAIQQSYLLNGTMNKITDTVTINPKYWTISDTEVKYIENNNVCVSIKIDASNLIVTIDSNISSICEQISNNGIESLTIPLQN